MSRLTERDEYSNVRIKNGNIKDVGMIVKNSLISDALDKLSTFEDAEEQGRLVKKPFDFGTTIWLMDLTGEPVACVVHGFSQYIGGEYIIIWDGNNRFELNISNIGKSVFLTKEAAEKRLEELNRGKNN